MLEVVRNETFGLCNQQAIVVSVCISLFRKYALQSTSDCSVCLYQSKEYGKYELSRRYMMNVMETARVKHSMELRILKIARGYLQGIRLKGYISILHSLFKIYQVNRFTISSYLNYHTIYLILNILSIIINLSTPYPPNFISPITPDP